jgi:hypothetical protein
MSSITKILSADAFTTQGDFSILYDEFTIKSDVSVNLNLININEDIFRVKTLTIDWGDGTVETYNADIYLDYYNESIMPELLYNKGGSVCLEYNHTYNPASSAYFNKYVINVQLTYLNTVKGQFILPIKVAKPSLYDKINDLKIVNTQILPLSSSNTLLNLQTDKEFYIIPVITASSIN